MSLRVVNVNQTVQTEQPFKLVELAAAGEMALQGYICLGAVTWHKHTDNDEAFLVLDGAMALESEWGRVMLHPGELAVVPKGIAHRSGSQSRTLVVLTHARGLPERKNGHRRILGIPGGGEIRRIKLQQVAGQASPFLLEPMAKVDEYGLQLVTGNGLSPAYINYHSDVIWLMIQGQARFEAGGETAELDQGDLVVIPRDTACQWFSFAPITLFWVGIAEGYAAE